MAYMVCSLYDLLMCWGRGSRVCLPLQGIEDSKESLVILSAIHSAVQAYQSAMNDMREITSRVSTLRQEQSNTNQQILQKKTEAEAERHNIMVSCSPTLLLLIILPIVAICIM